VEFWAKHKLDEQKYSDINLEELKTLLEGMLQEYPEKRITMKQVYESNFFKAVQLEESLNSSNFTTANSEI
jgi:serine/threonine protein kinase